MTTAEIVTVLDQAISELRFEGSLTSRQLESVRDLIIAREGEYHQVLAKALMTVNMAVERAEAAETRATELEDALEQEYADSEANQGRIYIKGE